MMIAHWTTPPRFPFARRSLVRRRILLAASPSLLLLAACGNDPADAALAPVTGTPTSASSPTTVQGVTVTLEPGFAIPGSRRRLRLSLAPSASSFEGRHVELESTNSEVASVVLLNDRSQGEVFIISEGTTQLRARVDGVASNTISLTVDALPAASAALVVERFGLYAYPDPSAPPGSTWYMPQVRLREPTGVASATLVGVSASMPRAPSLGICHTSRTWAPGSSADAFGADVYFHEPEFSFGPYTPSQILGPVDVVLLVRDQQGALGTIRLSKIMREEDLTAGPISVVSTPLGCP